MKTLLLLAAAVAGLQAQTASPFAPLQFLVGEWTGDGEGAPGQASGGFTFQFDLQNKVLVRRNFAEYPATAQRAAFRHDDLMVVYADPSDKSLRATYFDNEDHVIAYRIETGADFVRFTSDPQSGQPRFRMLYRKSGEGKMSFEFDIAPPGKPDAFARYITAQLRKKVR